MASYDRVRLQRLVLVFVLAAQTVAVAQSWTLDASLSSLAPDRGRTAERNRLDPCVTPLVVRVAPQTLLERLDRQVDTKTPVSEVILGTQANGTCHTCGKLSIELVPHDGRADFVLVLKGKCHSQTVGRNGPAVIRSSSTSRFVAKKRVVFDFERGFRAGPAVVSVTTELDVDGIGSTLPGLRGRIVQAVAERRTSETHDLAEQISNRLTKEHIIAEFDRHVDRQLDRLVQRPLFVQFSLPSAGMGGLPCCIRTTEDNIEICWGTSDSRAIRSLADKGLRRQGIVEVWLPFSWMGPEGERVFACWTSWRDLGRGIFAPGCSAPPIVEFGGRTRFPRIAVTLFDRWMVVQVAPQAEVLDELRIVAATASTGQSTR